MNTGDLFRYAGALVVSGAMVNFGIEYEKLLKSLPWQELTPFVEAGLTIYGIGEADNSWNEIESLKARGKEPNALEYIGKALRSLPALSLPIGYFVAAATGEHNPLYSCVLTGAGCVLGHIINDFGQNLRKGA
jgi:hypothetical protein